MSKLVTFQDAEGARWRAWQVETPAARAHLMDQNFRNGWLAFEREDGSERRRLNQVPEDWTHLAPEHLAKLCAVAVKAPSARALASATTVKMPLVHRPSELPRDR